MDAGETFQFMVDQFHEERPLVAADWRGFGRSQWPAEGYWFPDYLADLDALLDLLSPATPASLIGHSMGGNIAASYAGLRPERVRCIVNLEGLGLPRTAAEEAPKRMRKWLDQVKEHPQRKEYASFDEFAALIRFRYPRFSAATAEFVAAAWGRADPDGCVRLAGDPRHYWVNPVLYRREEAEACWRETRAPMLLLLGEESDHLAKLAADGTAAAFHALFPYLEIAHVAGAGHMLHIERPDLVAPLAERFLGAHE